MAAQACLGAARVSKWLLRHALEPPERPKWLLEHALERPERSKSLLEVTVRKNCSKWLLEVTVRKNCSLLHCPLNPPCSGHLATCMDMHGFTLVYIYIYDGCFLFVTPNIVGLEALHGNLHDTFTDLHGLGVFSGSLLIPFSQTYSN